MLDTKSVKKEPVIVLTGFSVFARPIWAQGRTALLEISQVQPHELTRAIESPLFSAGRPDWSRGQSALESISSSLTGAMMRAISGKLLDARYLSDWGQSRHAMANTFGFALPHHLFHALPVKWVQLTEPQATKAFAEFLNADEQTIRRRRRIQAFLRALGSGREMSNIVLHKAYVSAEASAGKGKRIDLLLGWKDTAGFDRGAVVEGKFGHSITPGQLKTYKQYLRKTIERRYRKSQSTAAETPLLYVVSSRRRPHDEKKLKQNKGWRWISWRSLLIAFDRVLEPDDDDYEFRQFRRTLWDRAGS